MFSPVSICLFVSTQKTLVSPPGVDPIKKTDPGIFLHFLLHFEIGCFLPSSIISQGIKGEGEEKQA